MPARKPRTAIVQPAKHGAELRLRELMHEARQLLRLFPDLRDSFDPDELPLSFILATARPARKASPPKARKRRRKAPKA